MREFLYFYFDNKIYNLDLYFIVFMFGIFELIFNFVWIFNHGELKYISGSAFSFFFFYFEKSLHRKTVWKFDFDEKIFRYEIGIVNKVLKFGHARGDWYKID